MKRFVIILIFITALGLPKLHAQSRSDTAEIKNLLKEFNILWEKHDYEKAMLVAKKTKYKAELIKDSLNLANALNNIGITYNKMGDPAKGNSFSEQSIAILEILKKYKSAAIAKNNFSATLKEQGNIDEAMKMLFQAARFFEDSGDLKRLSSTYNTLGNIYTSQKDKKKALHFLFMSLKLRREVKFEEGIASTLSNLGNVYMMSEQYDSALSYFESSLELKGENSSPEKRANTLSHMGEAYTYLKNFSLAESFYLQSYEIRKETDNKIGIARSLYELGLLYFEQKLFTKSKVYLVKSISAAKEANDKTTRLKCYKMIKDIYRAEKQYKQAFEFAESFIGLNDTLMGKEKQRAITEMEIKYETEKNQHLMREFKLENQNLEAKNNISDIQLKAEKDQNKYMNIGLICLMLIIFLVLVLFFNRMKFARKLDTLMRELHHRVMNNFQVLLSLSSLQRKYISDEYARKIVVSNSNRVTAMMLIHKELYLQKDITKVHIWKYIDDLINNLLIVYEVNHNVKVTYHVDRDIEMDIDKAIILGLLINELATNAFKHAFGANNPYPQLEVGLIRHEGSAFKLRIKDNGPGMLSGNTRSLGMKLAESQVKQLRGELQVTSDNGVCYDIIFK
jgi:two-component sensor histidine kinase